MKEKITEESVPEEVKMKIIRDFISKDPRNFKFKIGKVLASSLSGFIAGAIFASFIWGDMRIFIAHNA